MFQIKWWHSSSVMEPALPHRLRHTNRYGSFCRQQPFRDLDPERSLNLSLEFRMPWGPELRTNRPVRVLLSSYHPTPPLSRCCVDRLNLVSELLLIDLSAANDPESAREALASLGIKRGRIAPVLVNRWERPLRSLTFIAAMYGRFGTVGVAGTLRIWANRWVDRENRRLGDHGAHTKFISLPRRVAGNTEALWAWTRNFRKLRKRASRPIVLFENVHDGSADVLRAHFDREATHIDFDELRTKHG